MISLESLHSKIRRCKRCRLCRGRHKAVPGEGPCPARIMIIGQAPGRKEDESGRPFIGRAGGFLENLLEKAEIKRSHVFITSVVKCFPPRNRAPKKDEIMACNGYLRKQISLVKPEAIILLGKTACETLLETGSRKLKTLHGKPVSIGRITYLPTYHPAAGMRFPKIRKAMERDLHEFFSR